VLTTDRQHPIRLVIADSHEPTRVLLRTVLGLERDVKVIAEASTGFEAVDLACAYAADAVVLDADLPGLDGVAAAMVILARAPATRIVLNAADPGSPRGRHAVALGLSVTDKRRLHEIAAKLLAHAPAVVSEPASAGRAA
jgi:DNA-binding NarL/FixJ family response regulator